MPQQKCRVIFESKIEMQEYQYILKIIKCCFEPKTKAVIVSLSLLGWERRKIHKRTVPPISEYAVRQVEKEHFWLAHVRQAQGDIAARRSQDALNHLGAYLDSNGGIKIGGSDSD